MTMKHNEFLLLKHAVCWFVVSTNIESQCWIGLIRFFHETVHRSSEIGRHSQSVCSDVLGNDVIRAVLDVLWLKQLKQKDKGKRTENHSDLKRLGISAYDLFKNLVPYVYSAKKKHRS